MRIITIFFIMFSSVYAHPHTFIEVYPKMIVKDSKIVSLHFKWVLDDMTSSILLMEFDQNGDNKIDEKENKYIYEDYFLIFESYGYYTHIFVDSKLTKLPKPTNFKADIQNHKITYSFDIVKSYDIKKTYIEFGDTDFYVAMILKEKFLDVKGANAEVNYVDNDSYFGYKLELK